MLYDLCHHSVARSQTRIFRPHHNQHLAFGLFWQDCKGSMCLCTTTSKPILGLPLVYSILQEDHPVHCIGNRVAADMPSCFHEVASFSSQLDSASQQPSIVHAPRARHLAQFACHRTPLSL